MRRTRTLRNSCLAGAAMLSAACSGIADADRAAVARVTLSPPSATIAVGSSMAFQATVEDADGHALTDREVFWASEDSTVADVDSITGVVRAVRLGTTRIAASSEGKYGIAMVTVSSTPVALVVVLPSTAQVRVGATIQLQAVAYDASGNELAGRATIWASSSPAVASVDAAGRVTGVAAGSATISATSEGKTGSASVSVVVTVGSVTVDPQVATIPQGGTVQFTANLRDEQGTPVSGPEVVWSSQDTSVATVSSTGLATGVGIGSAEIRATSQDKTGTATIFVFRPPVASVDVTPSSLSLFPGQFATLTATPRDANGNALTGRAIVWSSSNVAIALVSQSGTVTALLPGEATVIATSEEKSGSAAVTVTLIPAARVEVSPKEHD